MFDHCAVVPVFSRAKTTKEVVFSTVDSNGLGLPTLAVGESKGGGMEPKV